MFQEVQEKSKVDQTILLLSTNVGRNHLPNDNSRISMSPTRALHFKGIPLCFQFKYQVSQPAIQPVDMSWKSEMVSITTASPYLDKEQPQRQPVWESCMPRGWVWQASLPLPCDATPCPAQTAEVVPVISQSLLPHRLQHCQSLLLRDKICFPASQRQTARPSSIPETEELLRNKT